MKEWGVHDVGYNHLAMFLNERQKDGWEIFQIMSHLTIATVISYRAIESPAAPRKKNAK